MVTLTQTRFLEIFPEFRTAAEALISDILASAVQRSFPADSQIYADGDACAAIAFLLAGEIRVFKIGEAGREITLYDIRPGETCILNASCILSELAYPAHAVATQAGELLLIPARDFRHLIAVYPEMRDFIFRILSRRLTAVMSLVEEVAFGRLDERLKEYLRKEANNGQLLITHQEIANHLGTSREVISRILKDLERKGLLKLSRNLIQVIQL